MTSVHDTILSSGWMRQLSTIHLRLIDLRAKSLRNFARVDVSTWTWDRKPMLTDSCPELNRIDHTADGMTVNEFESVAERNAATETTPAKTHSKPQIVHKILSNGIECTLWTCGQNMA
jgi:hypothetical protein